MPWTAKDAPRHTRKAKSATAKRQWREVANSVLARTGNDARAIRSANAVIARRTHGLDSVKRMAMGGKVGMDKMPMHGEMRGEMKKMEHMPMHKMMMKGKS